MQGIDAGEQLGAEGFVGIALMALHLAAQRVERQLIKGTRMVGILEQVEHRGRLASHRRQAQVPGHQLRPGG